MRNEPIDAYFLERIESGDQKCYWVGISPEQETMSEGTTWEKSCRIAKKID